MAKNKMSEVDIQAQAVRIISDVWINNEEAYSFITEKVAFNMKNLIRTCRKNYWGVFDEQKDPITGRKKIWQPLTEASCEGVIKNIDIDSKDINVRAKNHKAIELAGLVRSAVKYQLDKQYFGELLDEAERQLVIDGTVIWKTIEQKTEDGYIAKVSLVDPLNFAIDPTVKSIDEADFVVERALITKDEFLSMDIAFNKDSVVYVDNLSRNDKDLNSFSSRTVSDYVEMYEGWGFVPESLFTGLKKDEKNFIQGKILASSNGKGGFVIHNITKNPKKIKPYEEAWYTRVHGRWYGRGIAEKLLMLQLYLNIIVNIRINRAYVTQLGLFKVKKGSKITPQMLGRLASNGVIKVNNMSDIEQLIVQEASQASYADEQNILSWAERVSQAFNIVTGEQLPASTPATNAVLQERNAQSGFTMVKEGFGMFLERWLNRQAMPIIQKNFKPGYLIQLTGDPSDLKALDEKIVNSRVLKELRKIKKSGKLFNPSQVMLEMAKLKERFSQQGNFREAVIKDALNISDFDIKFYVTNEDLDKGVVVQNLFSILDAVNKIPSLNIKPEDIVLQIFDLMGLQPPRQRDEGLNQNVLNQQLSQTGNMQMPSQLNGAEQVMQANLPNLRQ
jgi:hypothetical protein